MMEIVNSFLSIYFGDLRESQFIAFPSFSLFNNSIVHSKSCEFNWGYLGRRGNGSCNFVTSRLAILSSLYRGQSGYLPYEVGCRPNDQFTNITAELPDESICNQL